MKRILFAVANVLIAIGVPFVLALVPVRAFMQPWVIPFQYSLPDFPPDDLGMSSQERLRLGLIGIDSVIGSRGVVVLAEAQFDDGQWAFNAREIAHMQDVRGVIDWMFPLHTIALILWLALAIGLSLNRSARRGMGTSFIAGVLITAVAVAALGVFGVTAWDAFFTAFHRIFFTGDTWLFLNTDTLIRLYPEVFWFRITLMIGGVTLLLGAVFVATGAWLRRSGQPAPR